MTHDSNHKTQHKIILIVGKVYTVNNKCKTHGWKLRSVTAAVSISILESWNDDSLTCLPRGLLFMSMHMFEEVSKKSNTYSIQFFSWTLSNFFFGLGGLLDRLLSGFGNFLSVWRAVMLFSIRYLYSHPYICLHYFSKVHLTKDLFFMNLACFEHARYDKGGGSLLDSFSCWESSSWNHYATY